MKKYIKYMIHTCLERERYVKDILVPSLVKQGIKKSDIHIWLDSERVGNLASWVESCKWVADTQNPKDAIWHLQDDVIPSKRFKEVAERDYSGIANGFCNELFEGGRVNYIGSVSTSGSWFSHQCKRIPNEVVIRFVDWYENECIPKGLLKEYTDTGKRDDNIFREYVIAHEERIPVVNLMPNIVDHIDFLIGGTVINKQRIGDRRQAYWRDEAIDKAVEELKNTLEAHNVQN